MSNDREELLDIARALRAQLEYYRELGLTELGSPSLQQTTEAVEEMVKRKKKSEPVREQQSLFAAEEEEKPARARRKETLPVIRADIEKSAEAAHCSDLCPNRHNIVFGEGTANAELMFVGEAPGADEDAQGRPFVGAAGRLLDKIIEAIGMKREDVYITNVVRCRPPGNRKPTTEEIEACEPFLFREIAVIKPKVIVTLGATPLFCLTRAKEGITKIRGQFREYEGIPVMPTFHPAFLLRVPERKREVWEDMKKVVAKLEELKD